MLAGEDHRHAQLQAGQYRRGDPRGFDGHDLGDTGRGEALGEFPADGLHQLGIDLVVEEGIDLEHLLGEYLAFAANLGFEAFHADGPLTATPGPEYRTGSGNTGGRRLCPIFQESR